MQKRSFDKLGIETPLLGMGTMRLPVRDGKIDRETAQEMVDLAMRSGVNYFDTALMYHNHTSEDFVGEALSKYPRDSYFLTTKMHVNFVNTKEEMARMFDRQLEKCKTDHFDFYLIHDVERSKFERIRQLEVYSFLKQKQAEGKLRYIGFSFHDGPEALVSFLEEYNYGFDVAQIQENYMDTTLRDAGKVYDILTEHNIPIIIMEPVKGGLLANVPEDAAALFAAQEPKRSPAAWALRWVASKPNVRVVLSGMSSMQQMQENIETMANFTPMTEAEYQVIEQVRNVFLSASTIPCTACRYCSECPQGIAIPQIFNAYNRLQMFGEREYFQINNLYTRHLSPSQLPEHCVGCGLCESLCPQHIHIIDLLKKADLLIKEAIANVD